MVRVPHLSRDTLQVSICCHKSVWSNVEHVKLCLRPEVCSVKYRVFFGFRLLQKSVWSNVKHFFEYLFVTGSLFSQTPDSSYCSVYFRKSVRSDIEILNPQLVAGGPFGQVWRSFLNLIPLPKVCLVGFWVPSSILFATGSLFGQTFQYLFKSPFTAKSLFGQVWSTKSPFGIKSLLDQRELISICYRKSVRSDDESPLQTLFTCVRKSVRSGVSFVCKSQSVSKSMFGQMFEYTF